MRIDKNIIVAGKHEKPILTDVFYKENNRRKPVVIFCHGYKGYKDWGAWDLAAQKFAEQDVFFLKFNFSHNGGTVEQPIDFPDLEAFGKNNLTMELDDLESVMDWVLKNSALQGEVDSSNITLVGHSRGGGIATLKAGEDKRVGKLVSWAGVSDFGARMPKGKELAFWKEQGVAYITNARTNQQMPHYFSFYENFIENKERLHVKRAAESLTIPHLIVQGGQDDVVLSAEAENLHKWSIKSELFMIDQMNHALGNVQPWLQSEMPLDLLKVVEKTIGFIK